MQDKENDNEMSMEEILASIRRYVADEGPETNQSGLDYTSGHTADVIRLTEAIDPSAAATKSDFTPFSKVAESISQQKKMHIIQDTEQPHSGIESPFSPPSTHQSTHQQDMHFQQQMPSSFTPPIHEPVILPFQKGGYQGGFQQNQAVQSFEQHQYQHNTVQQPVYTSSPQQNEEQQPQSFSDVITNKTMASTSQAFSKLSEAFQMAKVEKQQIDAQRNHGATAIESFVIELAKPMVRQWIEQHLPTLVDKLVTQEIEKLTDEMRKKLF